jgi:hypothetical protein
VATLDTSLLSTSSVMMYCRVSSKTRRKPN